MADTPLPLPPAGSVRQLVYFRGHVQGVGFRYTTTRVAQGFAVVGYVRNLSDGSVEVVAEGDPQVVAQFIAQVQETMRGYIDHTDVHTGAATGQFTDFGIR